MNETETIAAISTPWGEGGIGVIRISGRDALKVALRVFHPKAGTKELKERYLYRGLMKEADGGAVIDNGFFALMKGPRSYTGEDVVEFHCHGGPLVLKRVLEEVIRSGARLASPGEFTRQAFLNGKLDLTQAEAVIDVIRAQTELSLSSAMGRLEGVLSGKVREIKEVLFGLLTHLEAELDFPEDEVDGLSLDVLLSGIRRAEDGLRRMLSTYEEGSALKDGVKVLILGRPNVGKSSLLNILLKQERAIVTPVPGTTRDIIEEVVNIRGLPVRLMDTAGLRDTSDHVESIGVRLAKERIKDAGLILFVIDSSTGDFNEDIELLKGIEGKKVLVTVNKVDLVGAKTISEIKGSFEGHGLSLISALRSEGVEELKDRIYEGAAGHPYGVSGQAPPGELIVSLRHKTALEEALSGIERTKAAIEAGLAKEFIATDLRWSLDRLGEITGETTTEDILERIFSNFCIGK